MCSSSSKAEPPGSAAAPAPGPAPGRHGRPGYPEGYRRAAPGMRAAASCPLTVNTELTNP